MFVFVQKYAILINLPFRLGFGSAYIVINVLRIYVNICLFFFYIRFFFISNIIDLTLNKNPVKKPHTQNDNTHPKQTTKRKQYKYI